MGGGGEEEEVGGSVFELLTGVPKGSIWDLSNQQSLTGLSMSPGLSR